MPIDKTSKSLIDITQFVGKTIKSMNTLACNSITFTFTDGTTTALEVDCIDSRGLYGIVTVKPYKP